MTIPQGRSFNGFNYYEVIQRLETANLIIHTIPGEEWILSCAVHKTLLINVYTLSGKIAGTKRVIIFRCGRLCEILLKLLWYGRKVQYHSHSHHPEATNVSIYTRARARLAETLEADTAIRLRDGDIIFCLIPGESWRLTNTSFGRCIGTSLDLFYLAEEQTLGTPTLRIYKNTRLEHILLEFLCQNSAFVDHPMPSPVLEFKPRQRESRVKG